MVEKPSTLVSRWVPKQIVMTWTVVLDWYKDLDELRAEQKIPCLMKKRMMMIDSVLPAPLALQRLWQKVTRAEITPSMSDDIFLTETHKVMFC